MRSAIIFLTIVVVFPGCTSTRLKNSTLSQAETLADLQYQQVLNNVAMYCVNPEALPSFVSLRDGSAQIADLGSASYLGDWHWAFASHPSILGSRTVVEQWGMSPLTDDNELQLLSIAFRRAVGHDESLENDRDFANDLAHELVKQMPDVDDMRGTMPMQLESVRNRSRYLQKNDPPAFFDIRFLDKTLSFLYPTENDFKDIVTVSSTLSTMREQIIGANECISGMNVFGVYKADEDFGANGLYCSKKIERDSTLVGVDPIYDIISPEAVDARRQIKDIENDLLAIPTHCLWYGRGRKHDVPKDACYVGHYRDCYVWVGPGGLKELSILTLKTLKFAGVIKDDTVMTVPGPRFTPASAFPAQ